MSPALAGGFFTKSTTWEAWIQPTGDHNPRISQFSQSLSHVRLFVTTWKYTVHGILQARILEWVAFPRSPGDFPAQVSCLAGEAFTS